jgi:flagellar protein FliL
MEMLSMSPARLETSGMDQVTGQKKKRSKMPFLLGLFLSLALGAGGFFAVRMGYILASHSEPTHETDPVADSKSLPEVEFVPMDPLVITLGPGSRYQHLGFTAQIEVTAGHSKAVMQVLPRVIDTLNTYLRAVKVSDFEDPAILNKLRSQMLRRVKMVVGEEYVSNLLIMEFILN